MQKGRLSRPYVYFFGSFGGILFGYDIGVMTGALPFLQLDWHMHNALIIGMITSSLMFGAIFGGLLAGRWADRYGRKTMITVAATVFACGSLVSAVVPNDGGWLLIAVRIILGLSVGALSAIVPAYMAEMAPARLRGRMTGINFTMIAAGTLLSYVVDYCLKDLPASLAWRAMLGMAAVPALILLVGSLRLPATPRFLMVQGNRAAAAQVLRVMQPDADIDAEIATIQQVSAQDAAERALPYGQMLTGKYRALVIAGVGVAGLQQFIGVNAIFYYIPLIVAQATGHAAASNLMWPVIEGLILLGASFVFLAIASHFNRRTLLIFGGTGMGLAFVLPVIINWLWPHANPFITLVLLCIYVAFYGFTWAPLTWVLVGEIFPLAVRGKASGLASALNWVGAFVVGLIFPVMTAMMRQATVFGIFGLVCFAAVLFVWLAVPETKGHTLEEIEQQYTKGNR